MICHSSTHTFSLLYSCQNTSFTRNVSRKRKLKTNTLGNHVFHSLFTTICLDSTREISTLLLSRLLHKHNNNHKFLCNRINKKSNHNKSHYNNFLSKVHNNILQFHNPFSCHFHQILTRKHVSLLLLITFFTFIFIVKHLSKHPFYSLSQQIPVYCCCFLFICCISIINKKTHYI